MSYVAQPPATLTGATGFLQRVFAWMVLGLVTTAGAAAVIGASDELLTDVTSNPLLLILVFGGQLAPDGRGAIQGALALYLDFINLFLFLPRIFGRTR